MTIRVVALALVAVPQHAVGLGRFLEALLGVLVPRVAIGVVLEGEPAVRRLDLGCRGPAGHAQHLVAVPLGRDGHEGSVPRMVHGRSIAWPIKVAAFSMSTSRAFSSSMSPSPRAFFALSIAARILSCSSPV